ncbi:hypothetical protein PR048_028158 [Dryococelus australis]|uniref:Uncharacterized protein n=1 Tax=Dryococelus australis TaxID=614101 RepID=A0ABQ9GIG1_9NEOP|nr:hypothetical protein PR048_028158 [Dryococelus australis]
MIRSGVLARTVGQLWPNRRSRSSELRQLREPGPFPRNDAVLRSLGYSPNHAFIQECKFFSPPFRPSHIDVTLVIHKEINTSTGEGTGDPLENPLTSGIARHDSHMRKSRSEPAGNRTHFAKTAERPCGLRRGGGGELGKDWEGISHGLCLGPIPAFAWSDFGKPWKAEIRMAGPGIEPGFSRVQVQCVTPAPPRSIRFNMVATFSDAQSEHIFFSRHYYIFGSLTMCGSGIDLHDEDNFLIHGSYVSTASEVGPRWFNGQTTRLPSSRAGFHSRQGRSRISAFGSSAGRYRWSAGFLGDFQFCRALAFRRCSILTSFHPHRLSRPPILRATQIPQLYSTVRLSDDFSTLDTWRERGTGWEGVRGRRLKTLKTLSRLSAARGDGCRVAYQVLGLFQALGLSPPAQDSLMELPLRSAMDCPPNVDTLEISGTVPDHEMQFSLDEITNGGKSFAAKLRPGLNWPRERSFGPRSRDHVIMTSERTHSGRLSSSERVGNSESTEREHEVTYSLELNMISRRSASAVCMTWLSQFHTARTT